MKNKPGIILLLAAFVVAAGFGIFLLVKNSGRPSAGGEDVRLYYYRCIPGLKRAEDAGSVLPVHKSYALNDKGLRIELDRIWIGAEKAWVLYHVADGTDLKPSGTLVLAGPGDATLLYGPVTEETEQILADDGLYGYFIMRRTDEMKDAITVDQASLYPIVTQKRWLGQKVTELDTIHVTLPANPLIEAAQEITLRQEAHDIGSLGTLTPTGLTMTQSRTFLSMQWSSTGYTLYGLQGTLDSRRGESLSIDGMIDGKRVALPAFNFVDTIFTLNLDKAYFINPGTLTLGIDPKDYQKKSNRNKIEQPAFQPGGPQCILQKIRVEKDWVYLDMTPVDDGNGVLCADPWAEASGGTDTVYCINGTLGWMDGVLTAEKEGISLGIPRAMWDQNLAVWVQVRKPLVAVEPGLHIDLKGE